MAFAEPHLVSLPANLDLTTAQSLTVDLLALRGRPVALDASGVDHVGGLGLQVLLSAQATWAADSQDFEIIKPSEAYTAGTSLLGFGVFGVEV